MIRELAAIAITGYQRYLSPRKGFCCAWRFQTGGMSCSEYARRMVLRRGVSVLWTAMPRQFFRCRMAHQAVLAAGPLEAALPGKAEKQKRSWRERFDCSPCDLIYVADGCDGWGSCDSPCDCSF